MFYNYFKISIRNIRKHKLFSFINVFGLSFSLSICLIIIMLLADQFSYDRFNTEADGIYRINHTRSDLDAIVEGMATSPMPLAEELARKYTGVSSYTRLTRGFGNGWVKLMQDVNIPLSGFFADPSFFNMFQYEFEYGNSETALLEPYSVVLSKETAEKLFNKENPVGETIIVGELGSYKVTGVLKRIEGKSHIKFDGLASMATLESLVKKETLPENLMSWRNRSWTWTYVKLEENIEPETIEKNLAIISDEQYGAMDDMDAEFYLQNIRAISPGPMIGNQIGPGIPMIFVYFLAGMAIVVIVSSCFNYTNLSIARSLNRAREVGIRKVFGAVRFQILMQFLTESIIISVLAFVFSLGIVQLMEPIFLDLNFSQLLDWNLNQSLEVYLICLAFSIAVGFLAGIVPASFHSSVRALQALKNLSGVKVFSKLGLRNALIVAQFGLSVFLVITVKLIYDQMNFMVDSDYGFEADNIVVVKLNNTDSNQLKHELLTYPEIRSVSAAGFVPASGSSTSTTVLIDKVEKELQYFEVDEDYVENMGLTLVAGSSFTKDINQRKLVINEEASTSFGYPHPLDAIGQIVVLEDSISYEVIGVMKNYNHETFLSSIKPMALIYNPKEFGILQVRVNSSSYEQAIESIETAWEKVNPDLKIEYKLMSDEIAFFADLMFGDLTKIVSFISFLAIIIACLGLMGMVVFSTQSRLKEVSIRKVLGASNQALIFILSKGFAKLLLLAVIISVPLTWVINNSWMNFIAFRVEIGAGVMLFGVAIVAVLGLIVVGSQTWQAANTNPSKVLRDE
ncbi:ABC-type transport system, involved in lipoprotein release, permease component [Reichenbachiella faecimaris]|uniref:ABC-type transport system, involved in lipoprotein release, permease component n=2 Tax=Reichenbachiella faecimaris TaxID=692418 RepID=A0A1W2GAX9_REIFA|nr:ABC-type transport system, involved in lipoprotein release, permease component [Reichenbachiella faecimaris]